MELMKVESKEVTMTSLELVEFINSQRKPEESELRHDNFMAKVPVVLGKEVALNFKDYYIASNGKQNPCYRFPKREACLMAMSYSYELQAKVFDRMTELERKASVPAPQFQIPQTLPEALRLAADLAEKNAEQAAVIEQQKPAVEFVGRYVEAKQSQCLTDVAKIIGWKPRAFTKRLEQDDIIFHRGVWLPRQEQIEAGRFEVKTGEEKGFAFRQTRVTPKGITWLAKKYGEPVTAH